MHVNPPALPAQVASEEHGLGLQLSIAVQAFPNGSPSKPTKGETHGQTAKNEHLNTISSLLLTFITGTRKASHRVGTRRIVSAWIRSTFVHIFITCGTGVVTTKSRVASTNETSIHVCTKGIQATSIRVRALVNIGADASCHLIARGTSTTKGTKIIFAEKTCLQESTWIWRLDTFYNGKGRRELLVAHHHHRHHHRSIKRQRNDVMSFSRNCANTTMYVPLKSAQTNCPSPLNPVLQVHVPVASSQSAFG